MIARKEESQAQKFEKIPEDLASLAVSTFGDAFKEKLNDFEVVFRGFIYPSELLLCLTLKKAKTLKNHNFQVSLDHDLDKADIVSQIHLGIDLIATFLEEFLSEEDLELPLDWHQYEVQKQQIHLMYSTNNFDLEAQANELLGEDFDSETNDESELGEEFFKVRPEDMN